MRYLFVPCVRHSVSTITHIHRNHRPANTITVCTTAKGAVIFRGHFKSFLWAILIETQIYMYIHIHERIRPGDAASFSPTHPRGLFFLIDPWHLLSSFLFFTIPLSSFSILKLRETLSSIRLFTNRVPPFPISVSFRRIFAVGIEALSTAILECVTSKKEAVSTETVERLPPFPRNERPSTSTRAIVEPWMIYSRIVCNHFRVTTLDLDKPRHLLILFQLLDDRVPSAH